MSEKILMRTVAVSVILMTCLSQPSSAQAQRLEPQTRLRIDSIAAKIKDLSRPTPSEEALGEACRTNCQDAGTEVKRQAELSRERRQAILNRYAAQIGKYVDAYIAYSQAADPKRLQGNLQTVLAAAVIAPPKVIVADRVWVVAYVLNGVGAGGSLTTRVAVRAYSATASHGRIAVTGSDLDGRARMSIQLLPTPTAGQVWLIASGYMTGANGPYNGMRVYVLDGNAFRTVWKRDVWGDFTARPTQDGFRVDGEYYRTDRKRHDRYLLTASSVQLARK